jgi:hypothetical protein
VEQIVDERLDLVCIHAHMRSWIAGTFLRLCGPTAGSRFAQKGSHINLKHPVKPGRVTVPHPRRDLPIGTLKSIEHQALIKLR